MASNKELDMKRAIYPGTFDPITLGHIEIIERAQNLFPELIIAVAENRFKHPLFSLEERVEMISKHFQNHQGIRVIGFHDLFADLMRREKADIIIRGLRAIYDFEYELQIINANKVLGTTQETIFLMASPAVNYISSSFVRELALAGGPTSNFVAPTVEAALRRRLSK